MKIKPEHYAQLAAVMRAGLVLVPSAAAYDAFDASIPRIRLAKDRQKRRRWDALYAVGQANREVLLAVYEYANDDHIDTALRAIVKDIDAPDRAKPTTGSSVGAELAKITREGR